MTINDINPIITNTTSMTVTIDVSLGGYGKQGNTGVTGPQGNPGGATGVTGVSNPCPGAICTKPVPMALSKKLSPAKNFPVRLQNGCWYSI